jgi:hypothetical protein
MKRDLYRRLSRRRCAPSGAEWARAATSRQILSVSTWFKVRRDTPRVRPRKLRLVSCSSEAPHQSRPIRLWYQRINEFIIPIAKPRAL